MYMLIVLLPILNEGRGGHGNEFPAPPQLAVMSDFAVNLSEVFVRRGEGENLCVVFDFV